MKRSFVMLGVMVVLVGGSLFKSRIARAADEAIHGPYSVEERLQQYGTSVQARLAPDFARAGIEYPPARMTLVILKQEREVQLYAAGVNGDERYIRTYPILAASGHAGPKLQEGDGQVPEGIYAVESLNPNSAYHLALHVNYPNAFDRAHAQADGRTQLGGNIMIHGSDVSIGCVALGDIAAEEIFVLTAKVGLPQVRLLFCPVDFRTGDQIPERTDLPVWTGELYGKLAVELKKLPVSVATGTVPSP